MNKPQDLIRLLRPQHWVKSGFVLVGLLFGHVWGDTELLWRILAAAAGFSLVASCIYVLNDMADLAADRIHPLKRHRPLAAGRVSPNAAIALALASGVSGGVLGYYASPMVAILLAIYGVMNIAYSLRLKRVVILDVFIIAAGFMLRILAGTSGVGIPPSQWLLLCGLMLTLFLGFVKRRAELGGGEAGGKAVQRKVLQDYSPALLDHMITVAAAGIIMSYSLYTVSPDTIALHGTTHLIATVPLVMYGVFRYIFLLHARHQGEDPARDTVRDPHLIVTFVIWLGLTLWLIAH